MAKTISLFVLLFVYAILIGVNAQSAANRNDVNELLQKVNSKMNSIQSIKYNQYRSVFYKEDDYRESDTSEVILDYNNRKISLLPKYQINGISGKKLLIYNGRESFVLNKISKSLDVDVDTSSHLLEKQSSFRQSWPNIRNLLPEIIRNNSIQKSIVDTAIFNKDYFAVKIYYPQKRFNALTGLYNISIDTIQWRYELLIDKHSLLPQQFNVNIQTPHNRENYIRLKFDKMIVNPTLPDEKSWYFSTYQPQYPNHTAKQNDLVQQGEKIPAWKLPTYTSKSLSDTISSKTLKGKVVLLEFWIKGCGYCMAAMPYLNEIQNRFGKDSFKLITINCWDPKEELGFFHTKYNPDYTMCYNGRKLAENLGIYGFPMALLIDQEGTLVDVAPFSYNSLTSKISEILNNPNKKITANSMK